MKTVSCGILVITLTGELLLCHVTGAWHWDIPKGGTDPGEQPLDTALRETQEECGLDFSGHALIDLGRMAYRPRKDLHLFAALSPRIDATNCRCSTRYLDHFGRSRPEMDGYEWVRFDRVHRRCARHMGEVLTQKLSLPLLMARLQAQPTGRA